MRAQVDRHAGEIGVDAGCADGGRSADTASAASGDATDIRAHVLGFELWVSSVAQGVEKLDGWLRRRLRCLLWRQWKRPRRRARRMIALGIPRERAWLSARNGRGPWWNAGASHLTVALPASYFPQLGLVSLLATQQRLRCAT